VTLMAGLVGLHQAVLVISGTVRGIPVSWWAGWVPARKARVPACASVGATYSESVDLVVSSMRPIGLSQAADLPHAPVPAMRRGIVSRRGLFARLGAAARVTQMSALDLRRLRR